MEDDGHFTFAVAERLAGSGGIFPGAQRIGAGRMYPVFGRPRSPPRQRAPEQEPESTTATARVPLGQFLLVDKGRAGAAQPPYGGELETTTAAAQVPLGQLLGLVDRGRAGAGAAQPPYGREPEKTCYCSWCPGLSWVAKPATRFRKSGSTGSILQWRQRLLGRSQSDGGKEQFVFMDAAGSERKASRADHVTAWSYYAKTGTGTGTGGSNNGARRRSFLPYRQDLVGLFASPTAFRRRSYHPF